MAAAAGGPDVRAFLGRLSSEERAAAAGESSAWSPLHAAALHGDATSVAALLATGLPVDAVVAPPGAAVTPASLSATAAEGRYGRWRWAAMARERDGIARRKQLAARSLDAAAARVGAASALVDEGTAALALARQEEKATLAAAVDEVSRVTGLAEKELQDEEEKAKVLEKTRGKLLAAWAEDTEYREATAAEEFFEATTEELLRALAAVNVDRLRDHLQQLRTARAESIWSFRLSEKRRDLDTLTGQVRIVGVAAGAIEKAEGAREPAAALVGLVVGALSDVEPAKSQFLAERQLAVAEKHGEADRARTSMWRERKEAAASAAGRRFMAADMAHDRATGVTEQRRREVQGLKDEAERVERLGEQQAAAEKQETADAAAIAAAEAVENCAEGAAAEPPEPPPPSLGWRLPVDRWGAHWATSSAGTQGYVPVLSGAEHWRCVRTLHVRMGEHKYTAKQAEARLAAAGGNLQHAVESLVSASPDVALSFPARRRQKQQHSRRALRDADANTAAIAAGSSLAASPVQEGSSPLGPADSGLDNKDAEAEAVRVLGTLDLRVGKGRAVYKDGEVAATPIVVEGRVWRQSETSWTSFRVDVVKNSTTYVPGDPPVFAPTYTFGVAGAGNPSSTEPGDFRWSQDGGRTWLTDLSKEVTPPELSELAVRAVTQGRAAKGREPTSFSSRNILQLINASRAKGLYPPQSMDLGFPAKPGKRAAGASSAPSWINGPQAKKEVAKGRLWRSTWDKPGGVGDPPPVAQSVSTGLWSQDLPDDSRHDLMRNLLMGMLQIRCAEFGCACQKTAPPERPPPCVITPDYLERSVFVGKVPHEHAQPEDKFSSNAKSWLSEFGSIEQVKCNFIQRETIPLPSGETIYRLDRESFCLVTFATAAEKTAALGKAPDKPELEEMQVRDAEDDRAMVQFSEFEMRANLVEKEQEINALSRGPSTDPFYASFKLDSATESLELARRELLDAQTERDKARDALERASAASPAYPEVTDSTAAVGSAQEDEAMLRKSGIDTNVLGKSLDRALYASAVEDKAPAKLSALRAQVRVLLAASVGRVLQRQGEPAAGAGLEEEMSELERDQMEANAGNIEFEQLNDVGSIPTLLKYSSVPAILGDVLDQIVAIADAAEEVPDQGVWQQLLVRVLALGEGEGSGRAERTSVAALLASVVDWHDRCGPDLAEQQRLRQQVAEILSRLSPKSTAAFSTGDISEEEHTQMEANASNIDFEQLADASSLPTLLKYMTIPSACADICVQLVQIAGSEESLPEPGLWSALLRSLQEVDYDGNCAVESVQALAAVVAWNERMAPVGCTALHVAAMQGHTVICRSLLENKADPSVKDSNGFTALDHVVRAQASLRDQCSEVELSASETMAAYESAAGSSTAELDRVRARLVGKLDRLRAKLASLEAKQPASAELTALLSGGVLMVGSQVTSAKPLQPPPDAPLPAIQAAVVRGDRASVINRLCAAPNLLNQQDTEGLTLLHWAAKSGQAGIVDLLIGRGADIAVKNKRGMTVMHCAKGAPVAEMLLNAGADPLELDGSGCTAAQVLRGQPASAPVPVVEAPEEETAAQDGDTAAAAAAEAEMRPGGAKFASSFIGQAKDAALQREAKAAAAKGDQATATRLMQTRMSGRMERARKVAAVAASVQKYKTPPAPREATAEQAEKLWGTAKAAGEALERDQTALAAIEAEQRRQQSSLTRPEPRLAQQVLDVARARDLRLRISDRAHAAVREALVEQENAGVAGSQGSLLSALEFEQSEALAAVAAAEPEVEAARTEAKAAVAVALATRQKALDAVYQEAGDLPVLGTWGRKGEEYKQAAERGVTLAAKSAAEAKLDGAKKIAGTRLALDGAKRRLERVERLLMPVKPPWPEPTGGFMPENEIRRKWTGDADEVVLMHFFKRRDLSLATLEAAQKCIRHYQKKWRGEDWRKKMYTAAASKYGGTDPRVAWLRHCAQQPQKQHYAYGGAPATPAKPKQHQRSSGALVRVNHACLAAADAIDAFLARSKAQVDAHEIRLAIQRDAVAACEVGVDAATERHAAVERTLAVAQEDLARPEPTQSPAQLRFLEEDVASAEQALRTAEESLHTAEAAVALSATVAED